MISRPRTLADRTSVTIRLELSHGRHGASAEVEFLDGLSGTHAWVQVRGWIESVALRRLLQILDDLAQRGVVRVVLDLSALQRIDFRGVSGLVATLASLEARSVEYAVGGLSHHARDLFRIAGCDPDGHAPSDTERFVSSARPAGEWAS